MGIKQVYSDSAQFMKEVYYELKKATWLSWKEVVGSTATIVVLVVILALFVSAIDLILSFVFGLFLR
ncbi:MAG: preprotein translocase subunit SecE [Elusimicrobiota bacterium]